jgi:S-formylglutathione hydrolase FrmB
MLREINLISGPFPLFLALIASITVLVTLGRKPRLRPVVAVIAASALVIGVARLLLPGSVDVARIPHSFYVWAAVPLVAAGITVISWRSSTRTRRLAGLLAIPLTIAFAADQVDAWFAYVPTAADLTSAPLPHEVAWPVSGAPRNHGVVVRLDIPATTSGFRHRRAVLWLPPAAQGSPAPALPVVMMLAGTPGRPDDFLRAGNVDAIASRYAAAHHGVAPILVFPDHNGSFAGDTECVDGPRGRAETYLTVDVPRFVTTSFGAAPSGWGIFGYSEGGTCALDLSLRHRDLFGGFVDIGGDMRPNLGNGPQRESQAVRALFGGDRAAWSANDPLHLLGSGRFDGLAGWFVAGSADRPARHSDAVLVPAARAAGIDTSYRSPQGHHSFGLVASVTPSAFGWLADRITAATPGDPQKDPTR